MQSAAESQSVEGDSAGGASTGPLGGINLSSAIYGSLLITALVAAQGRDNADLRFIGASVLISVGAFWLMEVWSNLVSLRVRGPITLAETRTVAADESPMLAAAIAPLLALSTNALGTVTVDQAVSFALIVSVVQLFGWGLAVGRAIGKGWRIALVVAAVDCALGLVVVLLKVAVIH